MHGPRSQPGAVKHREGLDRGQDRKVKMPMAHGILSFLLDALCPSLQCSRH